MKITAVDHITINMRDPERSFRFYEQVLGLSPLETVDLGDHVLHYYQLPGTRLELIRYKDQQKAWDTGNTDTGIYRHMAIVVEDLTAAHQECLDFGCTINMPPTHIAAITKTVMLAADPNGVEIEFIQA